MYGPRGLPVDADTFRIATLFLGIPSTLRVGTLPPDMVPVSVSPCSHRYDDVPAEEEGEYPGKGIEVAMSAPSHGALMSKRGCRSVAGAEVKLKDEEDRAGIAAEARRASAARREDEEVEDEAI